MTKSTNQDSVASDLTDERLIQNTPGLRGALDGFVRRVRTGDLGQLPVVIGLIVIWATFQALNPIFLSPANLVNLTLQCAAIGTIAVGIVLVLLLGEIDLSVGSMSGLASAILAVTFVQLNFNLVVSVLLAVAAGVAVGLAYGFLYTRFGVPSFVITLSGLLALLGAQLYVLGSTGSINVPFDSPLVQFVQQAFLPAWVSYVAVALVTLIIGGSHLYNSRMRKAAGLSAPSTTNTVVLATFLAAGLGLIAWYLNQNRGVGAAFVLFLVIVVTMNLVLTRTRWGRAVYAVGGNVEAARRAGINVSRLYISVFVLCSSLAAVGGILAAGRLAAVNQGSGGGDVNLNAIAAAVIGGTSLFGGRGSAYSALLGVVVIVSIASGLTLLNLDSSIRYIVTGLVLLLAVVVDALSRRRRTQTGRA